MSATTAPPRRRPRSTRVPSHLNDRTIVQLLRDPAAFPLFPLTKLVAVIAVRDVRRLCLHQPATALQLAKGIDTDAASETGAVDAARRILSLAVIDRLTGRTLPSDAFPRLESDADHFIKFALRIDSHSRHTLEAELYDVDADNTAPSASVSATMSQFCERADRSWLKANTDPLSRLRFTVPLDSLADISRQPCPRCQHSAFLYCPHCKISNDSIALPRVRLPVTLTILHHDSDRITKSTSIHACVTAPQDTEFLELRDGLPVFDPARTLLLFPSEHSQSLDDPTLVGRLQYVDRLLLIESSWQKSGGVATRPELAGVPHCKIPNSTESLYWRFQEVGAHALSSIEAIHAAMKILEAAKRHDATTTSDSQSDSASGKLDDLLFIFAFYHRMIRARYTDEHSGMKRLPKAWSTAAPGAAADT